MDGKREGQSPQGETRPVLLFVHDLDQEVRKNLETGLEKMGLGIGVLDCHQEYASGRYDFNPRIIIASGSTAMQYARSAHT
jgi:hypothetical protein